MPINLAWSGQTQSVSIKTTLRSAISRSSKWDGCIGKQVIQSIYLGEGTPGTSLFLETLQSKTAVGWKPPVLDSGGIEDAQHVLDYEVEVAAREWVLAQPWFKRVWILQEFVLSQDPLVQCGTSTTRWGCFHSHISEIEAQRPLKLEEKIIQNIVGLRLQHQYSAHQFVGWAKNYPPNFAETPYGLLKSRKGFGVTDPRDMLFANVGLVHRTMEPDLFHDDFENLVKVDYQKNETEVYSDLARYLYENIRDFRIFALLESNVKRRENRTTSWFLTGFPVRPPYFRDFPMCCNIKIRSPVIILCYGHPNFRFWFVAAYFLGRFKS
jgi:hypothetical protein